MRPGLNRQKTFIVGFSLLWVGMHISLKAEDQERHEIKEYITSTINVENQNWNISQNPVNGLIYMANSVGLVEYNGISQKIYYLPNRKGVRSVHIDQKGSIFTGSFEEFGYWIRQPDGRMSYFSLAKKSVMEKNDEIWKIYELGGKIYFQSFTTVYCYDYNSVTPVKAPFTMLFMFRVKDKFIAQVLGTGLYWFNGNTFEMIHGSEIFVNTKVHAIIEDSKGDIYICTANQGIYNYNNNRFSYFESEISSYLKIHSCNAGLSLNDSLMVFGTILNGIVFCNRNGQLIKSYNYSNGLNNNTVLSLSKDNENGLWIGLDEGVNYLDIYSPYTYYTNTSGTLGTIYTVLKDENQLYMGTNHGLFVADILKENEYFSFANIRLIPNSHGQVWTLNKFDDQIICGHNEGTFAVEGNSFRQISDITGGWAIIRYNDLLIEGTYTGIVVFEKNKKGEWIFRNKIKYFNEPVRNLEIDYLGFVWASGHSKGIYKIELNETFDSVLNTEYYDIVHDQPLKCDVLKINGKIAFTTAENLYTYNYDQKKPESFSSLNSGIDEFSRPSQIIPFTKNTYWIIQDQRIALYEISKNFRKTKKFEFFQKTIDLPERKTQIISLDENTLLIPTRQAFSIYNLNLTANANRISRIQIRLLSFQGKNKTLNYTSDFQKSIDIPFVNNNLSVYFADPGRFGREEKTYYYKIKELNEDWHKTTFDNFMYLNLKYGNYHVMVRSDSDKIMSEVSFTIKRPWFLTIYAYFLYIVIFMGLVFIGFVLFRLELQKQKQRIEFESTFRRLETELDYKSNELMLTMRYLIQKDDILTELQKQINLIKANSSNYPVKFLREMEKTINESLKSHNQEWNLAMDSLKLSQQGFFRLLKDKHPELTPHDLKLCSYLRMNFTSKEIARLLNITLRGVEISRYRLRRKMKLDHMKNLTEYLFDQSFEAGKN